MFINNPVFKGRSLMFFEVLPIKLSVTLICLFDKNRCNDEKENFGNMLQKFLSKSLFNIGLKDNNQNWQLYFKDELDNRILASCVFIISCQKENQTYKLKALHGLGTLSWLVLLVFLRNFR
jgi:hypothetical protein